MEITKTAATDETLDQTAEMAVLEPETCSNNSEIAQHAEAVRAAREKDGGASTRHFDFEVKAWIPQDRVADPEDIPGIGATSFFAGDNHAGYDGSHRALGKVSFDHDGVNITNLTSSIVPGMSHRHTVRDGKETVEHQVAPASISVEEKSPGRIEISLSASNPFPLMAPSLDATYQVGVSPHAFATHYDIDGFPNHGLRLAVDGQELMTRVINDVSGVDGMSASGMLALLMGLSGATTAAGVESCRVPCSDDDTGGRGGASSS